VYAAAAANVFVNERTFPWEELVLDTLMSLGCQADEGNAAKTQKSDKTFRCDKKILFHFYHFFSLRYTSYWLYDWVLYIKKGNSTEINEKLLAIVLFPT
jgi:hypothetical protein